MHKELVYCWLIVGHRIYPHQDSVLRRVIQWKHDQPHHVKSPPILRPAPFDLLNLYSSFSHSAHGGLANSRSSASPRLGLPAAASLTRPGGLTSFLVLFFIGLLGAAAAAATPLPATAPPAAADPARPAASEPPQPPAAAAAGGPRSSSSAFRTLNLSRPPSAVLICFSAVSPKPCCRNACTVPMPKCFFSAANVAGMCAWNDA